ncbi:hypothetical protein FZC33_08605 [Labrys sp. KNU-23]|uniref:sulfotransferase family 2 domain-containing protein n=1 Tax=Labrys sp. KNU-23 TaxID=2789216 RepID=UPI0011EC8FF1|nr:sulfotransferase family 2 domain-containing protein [Labrys sp. KNU-23]QEN86228.1 hypothetical protein FZC33_08605 [Labrys sp. KNU-23]
METMTDNCSAIAYIDTEYKNPLRDRITRIEGWVSSHQPIDSLSVFVNRQQLGHVDTCERPDVPAATNRPHALGWNVFFEPRKHLIGELGSILIEVAVNGSVVQRRYHRYEPRPNSARPAIYFMHIPKTAGSSTRRALQSDPDIYLLEVYHQYPCLHEEQFATFTDGALDDVDIVFGHYMYGLHRHSGRAHRYVSIVRDPVDHAISCYLYMKYVIKDERIVACSSIFDAFANIDDVTFDNYTTRYLAGYADQPKVGPAQFEMALKNVDNDFAFIGTVENYKQSLEAISFYLGKELPHHIDNVTPASDEMAALDKSEVAERLQPRLVHDLKLYQAICQRFPGNYFFQATAQSHAG